jgi:Nucleotidyl transferase AbiEii toxin, Type IV TA system
MVPYKKPEHQAVATALLAMDHDLLMACKCWFGGGTEIVLELGEYRLSKDIDFLCADPDGYRQIRSLVVTRGASALFGPDVLAERAFRSDQYGVRGIISVHGIPLRVEIIRESRIGLDGRADVNLGVPRLGMVDRLAEKMLANADRCQDRATACRDAVDLGMLALYRGPFPEEALAKAERAYGDDLDQKLLWVIQCLSDAEQRRQASEALGMEPLLLDAAARALCGEVMCLRPGLFGAAFTGVPPHPRQTHMVDASLDGGQVTIRRRSPPGQVLGHVPGVLDNPIGPAMVSENDEGYFLDGVRLRDMGEWQDILARRNPDRV